MINIGGSTVHNIGLTAGNGGLMTDIVDTTTDIVGSTTLQQHFNDVHLENN
jgi:hypothetical protein